MCQFCAMSRFRLKMSTESYNLPTPPRDIHVTTYADDITIYSSDKNYTIAQQRLQPYLEDVQTWTKANDLKLNASKTMTTLFTPDPA